MKIFKHSGCPCYKNGWVLMFWKRFKLGRYTLHIFLENGQS
jgi:hypothetical protein